MGYKFKHDFSIPEDELVYIKDPHHGDIHLVYDKDEKHTRIFQYLNSKWVELQKVKD